MLGLEFNQRLLFVTGKGGTGKTFLAGILGVRASEHGKKVLLIDAESTGELARHFERNPGGYEPVEVAENISILQIRTDEALSEYLNLNAKIPTWAKLTPLARLIDLISNAAPGVKEILVTGKICYEMKRILEGDSEFDVIFVDAPSSGHVVSLLDAPRALSELVKKGMIQAQTQWMQDILSEKENTGVLISCLSDEVVMSETKELVNSINENCKVNIAGIIVNKDSSLSDQNLKEFFSSKKLPKKVQKLLKYYENQTLQGYKAVSEFENLNVFSFPYLNENTSLLRLIRKHAHRLTQFETRK